MVSLEVFLIGLMLSSTLTGLTTEGVKKILVEHNVKYRANTVAGIVTTILSVAIGVGYVIFAGIGFSGQVVVCIVAQVFLSWLCAMVGYDKVVEVITKTKKGE